MDLWEEGINEQFSFLSPCFPSTHTMFVHWNLHNIILFNTENPEGVVEKTVGVHFSTSFVSRKNRLMRDNPQKGMFDAVCMELVECC